MYAVSVYFRTAFRGHPVVGTARKLAHGKLAHGKLRTRKVAHRESCARETCAQASIGP